MASRITLHRDHFVAKNKLFVAKNKLFSANDPLAPFVA